MKNEEKDFIEENEFTEKMKESGLREISRAERPNAAIDKALRESKNRITIYLDAEIVDFFKSASKNSTDGYQTLINRTLRQVIDGKNIETVKQHLAIGSEGDAVAEIAVTIKESLLKDKSFLNELAAAVNK